MSVLPCIAREVCRSRLPKDARQVASSSIPDAAYRRACASRPARVARSARTSCASIRTSSGAVSSGVGTRPALRPWRARQSSRVSRNAIASERSPARVSDAATGATSRSSTRRSATARPARSIVPPDSWARSWTPRARCAHDRAPSAVKCRAARPATRAASAGSWRSRERARWSSASARACGMPLAWKARAASRSRRSASVTRPASRSASAMSTSPIAALAAEAAAMTGRAAPISRIARTRSPPSSAV